MNAKQEVFCNLKKQILALEGFKESLLAEVEQLGRINEAFPNSVFPYAALHEFFYYHPEEVTATYAFISGLLSLRNCKSNNIIWISNSQKIFPPALKWFGISPHQVLFLHLKKQKDIAWAVQEALKCSSLAAVVGELPELALTTSRRFQLAIEEAGVGCFILRSRPKNLVTAAVSRWHIQPIHSKVEDGFPGVGYPHWRVALLKARNGKAASWDIEWVNGSFRYTSKMAVVHQHIQKQTG